jgi:hypothetical protein
MTLDQVRTCVYKAVFNFNDLARIAFKDFFPLRLQLDFFRELPNTA